MGPGQATDILSCQMQSLKQIKALLARAGVRPQRKLGQNFLIDKNLMGKLLELADVGPADTILEVGPATGSLTEELIERASRVVSVEIHEPLARMLARRLADRAGLTVICGDILAGKHELNAQVIGTLGAKASLVANLPYNIATPLVALCLSESWNALTGRGGCLFASLTFTVQQEVAERLCAGPGSKSYGTVSVLVSLLGRAQLGHAIAPKAFWPTPKVNSRMVRIDFDEGRARAVGDLRQLQSTVHLAFSQRRKMIGSVLKHKSSPFAPARAAAALDEAGIDPTTRPERVSPQQFLSLAEALA